MSTTVVTGALYDAAGTLLTNTYVTAAFVGDQAISNVDGSSFPLFAGPVLAVGGTFSIPLTDSNSIVPAGSQWRFQFCPPVNSPQCYTFLFPVTGTTQDVTSQISIPALVVQPINVRVAYSSSEIKGPIVGSIYYDLGLNLIQVYDGANWVPIGTGGTGTAGRFIDDEVPAGSGTAFTLSNIPSPARSLQLFQYLSGFGSILLRQGIEYTLSGSAITTVNTIPAGNLTAWFRY